MRDAIDVVRAFHAAFEERDEERFAALVADGVQMMNPLGNVVADDRHAALQWLRSNAENGVHITPAGEPEANGQVVRWAVTMQIAATEKQFPSVGVFHVRDGLIERFEPRVALPRNVDTPVG